MKKQKRKRRQTSAAKAGSSGLKIIPHPFNNLDPTVVKAALLAAADRNTEQFPALIEKVTERLSHKYPPQLISIVAAYSLLASVTRDGTVKPWSREISQHHIEVMLALAMTLTEQEWGKEPTVGADVQATMEDLIALAEAYHLRRLKALEREPDAQGRAVVSLQERLRLQTQAVRNWGSYSQVTRISAEMYAPLDGAVRAKFGFSASDLIAVARAMVSMLENRLNERMRWLSRVRREHKPRKMVQAYYKNHPSIVGDPDEFIKIMPSDATREQVFAMILQHADLLLEGAMTFAVDDVADIASLPHDVAGRVMDALAQAPGVLKGQDFEHFFMGNPVWDFPLAKVGVAYFCPIPQAIFSHIHRIMHRLVDASGSLPQLEARRSKYLEEKVAKLLTGAFPTATIRNGVKWRLGAVEYETDHLVLLDKVAIIVEDKSHGLTDRGLRGAPERVREHVKDLIGAPSEQSARLEGVILRARGGDADAMTALAPFGVDFASIERVLRFNVTLDDLTMLSSAERELKAAGWIRPDLALAPTMTLADLETVIDILGRPVFLLHYFGERQRVQREGQVFADEIDFLGTYLDNGLNMGDLEQQGLSVALTGASAPIDAFYNSVDAGIVVAKPKPKLSRYFDEVITLMEQKAFPHWSTVSMDLLRSATFEQQLNLEKALAALKVKVERNRKDPAKECCLVVQSHALKETAMMFLAFTPELAPKRKELAGQIADQVLEEGNFKRAVVILRDVSRWQEPYSTVLVLNRSSKKGT